MKDVLRDGFARAFRSKRYMLLVYLVNLIVAGSLGYVIATAIQDSLGDSAASETLVQGFDPHWYDGYQQEAQGVAATFDPRNTGLGAYLDGLETWLGGDFDKTEPTILIAMILYALVWTLLSPGFISRYASSSESESFFGDCARFALRFVLLALLAGAAFYSMFRWAFPPVSEWIADRTRETTDERVFAAYRFLGLFVVALGLGLIDLIFTLARSITVVRGLKLGVIVAPLRGLFVMVSNPIRTIGFQLALTGVLIAVLALSSLFWRYYAGMVEPGSTTGILVGVAAGQVLILARIFLKCWFLAGTTSLYECLAFPGGHPSAPVAAGAAAAGAASPSQAADAPEAPSSAAPVAAAAVATAAAAADGEGGSNEGDEATPIPPDVPVSTGQMASFASVGAETPQETSPVEAELPPPEAGAETYDMSEETGYRAAAAATAKEESEADASSSDSESGDEAADSESGDGASDADATDDSSDSTSDDDDQPL